MNLKYLEEEVYAALRRDFIADEDEGEYNVVDDKNFCTIPIGILLEILNTLVAPVVTALVSECLIRKLIPEKDNRYNKIRENANRLYNESQKKIEQRSEEILCENQTPESITKSISANLTVNITINSPEDGEKLLSNLKQYLYGNADTTFQ